MTISMRTVPAGAMLQHVSRTVYRGTALHFGRTGANRYDAADGSYGVLYLGLELPTALMESVFHQHQWLTDPSRGITTAEVQARLVRAVGVVDDLCLADLTAPGVMAASFGLNLEQLASRDYSHTQKISMTVHSAPAVGQALFDGVLYPSRNNYPGTAVALFERAKSKVQVTEDIDLADHASWPAFLQDYVVAVLPDPGTVEREE